MKGKNKRRKGVIARWITVVLIFTLASQGKVYALGESVDSGTEYNIDDFLEEDTVTEEETSFEFEGEQETEVQSSEELQSTMIEEIIEETEETIEGNSLVVEKEWNEKRVTLRSLLVGQSIKLGNQVCDTLYSKGKYIRIDNELYFSNEEGIFYSTTESNVKICNDVAENFNYVSGVLYYTVKEGNG